MDLANKASTCGEKDVVIDVASEQFGDEKLTYDCKYEQKREVQLSDEDKKERYGYLCRELHKYCEKRV